VKRSDLREDNHTGRRGVAELFLIVGGAALDVGGLTRDTAE